MSAPHPECPGCQMLLAQVQQLAAEVAELRARLDARDKHSGNSSKPPSSDHPHGPKAHSGKPDETGKGGGAGGAGGAGETGKRQRGGQKGHPGTTRALLPVEAVQVVPCVPSACASCHTGLPAAACPTDPQPIREQVWELPPLVWEVTEFQRHARTCPDCGQRTWGERPPDAPTGCLGFRAQAAVAVLTGGAQITRRTTRTLLRELLGLSLSLGTLSRVEASVSAALGPAVDEVAAAVGAAPVVNCDETPWREPGAKPWLWVATTLRGSLFRIAGHRDAEAFAALLPPQPGQIKGTDRYAVYTSRIPVADHAICWAHLARDFAAWASRADVAGTIARWLAQETGRLFAHWHAFRGGHGDRGFLWEQLEPVRGAVHAALSWGAASGVAKFTGLCQNLLERWEALWTFARVEGVEPTNNAAERAVRQGVLWRKVSLFTQSERGRTYVERMLTVKTTLRQQGAGAPWALLEFLTESLRAHQTGRPAPPLLVSTPA